MSDERRSSGDEAVRRLRSYVDTIKTARDAELQSLREGLAVNTALTTAIKLDVTAMRKETQPLRDAMETMEMGIRTIGKIGRAGQWIGRTLLGLIAVGVVLKFIFGGASWNDVSAAFSRIMGR